MALSGTSLNAATTTGAGTALLFDTPKTKVSMQVHSTGSPTSFNVNLEVSLDAVNFVSLASRGQDGIQTDENNVFVAARANLTSMSGGTSPTISAFIAVD